MEKGQTVLREKLKTLGFFTTEQLDNLVSLMRDWAINDIIQIDEYIILKGEPYDTLNKMYDLTNDYKRQMRERVKSQTK